MAAEHGSGARDAHHGIRTTAVPAGSDFILNGQKTFISNGQLCDIVIVVARTDPDKGHRGISLLVVESGMPGFIRGRNREKMGMQPIGTFQHNKFLLAELATELRVAHACTDRAIMAHCAEELTTQEASMVKWWNTELCNRLTDRCVQLHGGYGLMREYPVARAWENGRVQSIYGGTTEIMKEIIGRGLGL
jgi:alkylation response protein AidB-like acyl-CoA dehydrogenase